jgi:hypothetical protein
MKRRIVLSSTIDVTDGVHHAVQQGNRRRTAARHTVVERPRGTRDAFATRVSPSCSSAQARQDTTRYNRIQPDSMATTCLVPRGVLGRMRARSRGCWCWRGPFHQFQHGLHGIGNFSSLCLLLCQEQAVEQVGQFGQVVFRAFY